MTLEKVAHVFESSKDFNKYFVIYSLVEIGPHYRGNNVLEMGCGRGLSTSLIASAVVRGGSLAVVERALSNIEASKKRLAGGRWKENGKENWDVPIKGVKFYHSSWERFTPPHKFTDIVMRGGLEDTDDPRAVLKRMRAWLVPRGRVHVVVPNRLSLHRRVGVKMGMIHDLRSWSEGDKLLEHKRLYDMRSLRADILNSGYSVVHTAGILLKPLSNAQMQVLIDNLGDLANPVLQSLFERGLREPELAGEIYVCAEAR